MLISLQSGGSGDGGCGTMLVSRQCGGSGDGGGGTMLVSRQCGDGGASGRRWDDARQPAVRRLWRELTVCTNHRLTVQPSAEARGGQRHSML